MLKWATGWLKEDEPSGVCTTLSTSSVSVPNEEGTRAGQVDAIHWMLAVGYSVQLALLGGAAGGRRPRLRLAAKGGELAFAAPVVLMRMPWWKDIKHYHYQSAKRDLVSLSAAFQSIASDPSSITIWFGDLSFQDDSLSANIVYVNTSQGA